MIDELHGRVHPVILEKGDHIGGVTVSDDWAVAFVNDTGDGILVQGDHVDIKSLMLGGTRNLFDRLQEAQPDIRGEADAAVIALRARRHEVLRDRWNWNQSEAQNHQVRADQLLDWATDPDTPERDAGIYAALYAGEVQAGYLARQACEAEELRETVGMAVEAAGSRIGDELGTLQVELVDPPARPGVLRTMAGWFR